MQILPKLVAAPPLAAALAMDAALSSEQRSKHRVEEQLRETQDRFRLLVDSIKDYSIVMLDPNGVVTTWNTGSERIYGYSGEDILGRNISCLYPPEDVATGRPDEVLRRAAAQGRTEDEGWRVRKDGSRFIANVVITAHFDSRGVLQSFARIARDVTAQKADRAALQNLAESLEDQVKAQLQELRESEARLQGFIRHATAAIAFKGLDGRFLSINMKMEQKIGLGAAEILGKTNEDLFPEEICAPIRERDQRVLRLQQEIQVEEQWPRREDGTTRDYLSHKFPLRLRERLHIRRFRVADGDWWKTARPEDFGGYWGGEIAVAKWLGELVPKTATLYLPEDRNGFLAKHRFRADPQGPIEVLDAFWQLPQAQDTLAGLVPPLLVYADLQAIGDPRTLKQARLIQDRYLA